MKIKNLPPNYHNYYLTIKFLIDRRYEKEGIMKGRQKEDLQKIINRSQNVFYEWIRREKPMKIDSKVIDKIAEYFSVTAEDVFTHNVLRRQGSKAVQ